jgi:uncharacterized protein (TIGR02646 family)
VDRTTKPNILAKNETTWLLNYKAKLMNYNSNPTKAIKTEMEKAGNKYRHPKVKEEIKKMFSEKCAYCESHISHVDYGDIEHFRPKSKYPDCCFDWNNFLLACGICNDSEHKGAKFPEENEDGPFVNPVDEEPNEFFNFEFDPDTELAIVNPKNPRAITTERELGLNRTDLIRHRSAVVRKMVLITLKADQGDPNCLNEILNCCKKEEEYAAFARMLVKKFNLGRTSST